MSSGPELIRHGADALDVALTDDAVERLWALVERLLRWNKKINLIGPCDERQAIDRHIHDALGLLRALDREEVRAVTTAWTDVGAGAGLPGLALAIARPAWRFRLVEPIGKKIAFAQDAAAALELRGVAAVQARVENLEPSEVLGAMSRATFAPIEWVERARDLVSPGGLIVTMMGGDPDPEVLDMATHVDRFTLPLSGAGRTTVIIQT